MKQNRVFLFLLSLLATQIQSQNYVIDAGHSSVQIQVERFGVVDVVGRFKAVSGTISYSEENPTQTKAEAIISVESYDANNIGGEDAVKSKIFLDVESYPEIKFKAIKTIEKESELFLEGDLTIHGVTKSILLPFSIKGPLMDLAAQKQSIAFNASIIINRQDYGIAFDRKLPNGIKLVGDDVKITLKILAVAE